MDVDMMDVDAPGLDSDEDEDTYFVVLKCKEQEVFHKIRKKYLSTSGMLKIVINEAKEDKEIDLLQIKDKETFKDFTTYLEMVKGKQNNSDEKAFFKELCKWNKERIVRLSRVANYYDVKPLIKGIPVVVGRIFRNMNERQIATWCGDQKM